MGLYNVRLELARSDEFPTGSAFHGYEFVAPLDPAGHLDAEAWKANRAHCAVRRFTKGKEDEHGRLVHAGRGWRFDYDAHARDDDEPVFKLDRHALIQGEYLSVTEHDGVMRTFRIVSVRPA